MGIHSLMETSADSQKSNKDTNEINFITKTRLFKYIENFKTKKWNFSDNKNLLFFIFLLKT